MADFSKKTFSVSSYALSRPNYPIEFLKDVIQWHVSSFPKSSTESTIIDLGCGTGQVAFSLFEQTNFGNKIIGADPSEVMISKCQEIQKSKNLISTEYRSLTFQRAFAEKLSETFDKETIDLITAAQCFHWFKHDVFFKEAYKILKPHGSLTYFFYVDPHAVSFKNNKTGEIQLIDIEKFNKIHDKYAYDDPRYYGPYWEQPGKNTWRKLCKTVDVPTELFKIESIEEFLPNNKVDFANEFEKFTKDKLIVERTWTLDGLKSYFLTWSAHHNFVRYYKQNPDEWQHSEPVETYVLNLFMKEIADAFGIGPEDEIRIIWGSIVYKLRKI